MSIYEALKKAGCEIDNHESDLYVRATPEARNTIAVYREKNKGHPFCVDYFTGTDGLGWLEIPFLYDPWWQARLEELAT